MRNLETLSSVTSASIRFDLSSLPVSSSVGPPAEPASYFGTLNQSTNSQEYL